jgi:glycosyltransferase involved in cell wall biosynthesis
MKIRIIGESNDSGIGVHHYHYTQALMQIPAVAQHVELINFQDTQALQKAAFESARDDITISFVGTYFKDWFKGTTINWTVFESTTIPEGLLNLYKADTQSYLWIPSEWGRQVAIDNGVDANRIFVVPEGVDGNLYHPYCNPRQPLRPYRFLTLGKYEVRKSYTEIFEAFAKTYGNDPAVELIIKSGFFQDVERKGQEMVKEIESYGCNNIKLLWSTQDISTLIELYRQSDCFLFPTKAEGWGLPIIEAAACGLPLITTNYSAQTEFLSRIESSCLFVDYDIIDVNCPEYKSFYPQTNTGDWGKWAQPSVDSICDKMKVAYNNRAVLQLEAIKNSGIIRREFSWQASAIKSLDVLKKMNVL